jgi:transcriptional regulator with XRE-family HTH domain
VVASERTTFATLLKRYRMAAGLTQEELADRANLSVRGFSNLERGARHLPQHTTIELLAEALHLAGSDRTAFVAAARTEPAPDARPTGTLPTAPAAPTAGAGSGGGAAGAASDSRQGPHGPTRRW